VFSDDDSSSTYRSSLQEQAIQVTFAMVSLLLKKADESLKDYLLNKTNHQNIISDDVSELLPAIKIWTDWMSCHKQYWSPPLPFVFRTGYLISTIIY
jgi:PREDICTED: similar to telomerase-binding protein EST1A (ever shorter telomeres 1A) (telomerase subunit EST1A) (EST1-like protein A)